MNIGCDLDGVIIDHRRNQQRLLRKYGFSVVLSQISKETIKKLLSPEDYTNFKRELYGKMSLRADGIPHAKEVLQKLLACGHTLRLISRRNEDRVFATQWLRQRGFSGIFPDSKTNFVAQDKEKDIVCRNFGIELHIDDSPEVLEKLTAPAHRVLFDVKLTSHPAATAVVGTWAELFRHIQSLD